MNPTQLTTQYVSLSEAYLNIVDNNYGDSGFSGLWDCATGPNTGVCDRGDVIFNTCGCAAPGGSYGTTERRSLACEEMGHGVGLAHRRYGCMSQDWDRTNWTNHDVNHVNDWY